MKAFIVLSSIILGLLVITRRSNQDQNIIENFLSSKLFNNNFLLNGLNFTNDAGENFLLDKILLDIVPRLLGYPPQPTLPVKVYERNRRIALSDTSNDEIFKATAQEILVRSGFRYENHFCLSQDGYVTNLIRIINPLANRKKLKQPPVLLFHGIVTNPRSLLAQSAIQHHPERYPRTPEDGPITSSNRSLGFMLANNGWDVWLIETRGSEDEFKEKIRIEASENSPDNEAQNMTSIKSLKQIVNSLKYWSFSLDELIEHEIEQQVDRVREVTGSEKVSIFTYSISSMYSLSKFGSDPEFVKKKVHNYIAQAVPLNYDGIPKIFQEVLIEGICLGIEENFATLTFTDLQFNQQVRTLLVDLSRKKSFRYLVIKFVTILLFGSSAKYNTFLELPIIGMFYESASSIVLKHACQVLVAKQFQKYDFGSAERNKLKYGGQERPPSYNVTNIHVKNWLLISGGKDNIATPASARQILETVKPKPYKHIHVVNYNHIDSISAFDNDKRINIPILKFLNKFQLKPKLK